MPAAAEKPSNPGQPAPARTSGPGVSRTLTNPGVPAAPRTTSSPGMLAPEPGTSSGQRPSSPSLNRPYAPAPLGAAGPTPTSEVRRLIAAEAQNTALNALSIFKELWADFRNSDRYFKYKALIIAIWIVLSASGFAVACPGSSAATTDFGAKLTISDFGAHPFYVIRNESTSPWSDVKVTVNGGEYHYESGAVEPGKDVGFGAKQLKGRDNRSAPETLNVRRLEIHTSAGDAVLIKDGKPIH
ncbi:MAG: hypothetical protein ACT4TC_26715 [Myxococcaceae bacterium]